MATSMKAPPVFDEETNYENYKKEVDLMENTGCEGSGRKSIRSSII